MTLRKTPLLLGMEEVQLVIDATDLQPCSQFVASFVSDSLIVRPESLSGAASQTGTAQLNLSVKARELKKMHHKLTVTCGKVPEVESQVFYLEEQYLKWFEDWETLVRISKTSLRDWRRILRYFIPALTLAGLAWLANSYVNRHAETALHVYVTRREQQLNGVQVQVEKINEPEKVIKGTTTGGQVIVQAKFDPTDWLRVCVTQKNGGETCQENTADQEFHLVLE